jgi:hypothetical protein
MAEMVERACQPCRRRFAGFRQRRYCSDSCRARARGLRRALENRARQMAETEVREIHGGGTVTKRVVVYVRRRGGGRRVVVCHGCGQTFLATRSDARTCSPRCRVDVMRRQQRRQQRLLDHPDEMDERLRHLTEYLTGRVPAGR